MIRRSIAAAALAWIAPAHAQAVVLAPGEMASVTVDGAVAVKARGAATLSPFEKAVVRQQMGGAYEDAIGEKSAPIDGDGMPRAEPVTPGQVRLKFVALPAGKGAMLVIENGYDAILVYRARIRLNGQDSVTDVCTVLPARRGFEHWPQPLESIALSDLRLEKSTEGTQPRCE